MLTNTGNGSDSFDLTSQAGGGFTPTAIAYYRDLGTVGTFDAADLSLADSNGNGIPDTGDLAAGAAVAILIGYTLPPAASGTASVVTTATSFFDTQRHAAPPFISAAVTDTLEVNAPEITVLKTVQPISDPVNGAANPFSIPGAELLYTLTATNFGTRATDTGSVVIGDTLPAQVDLVLDSPPVAFRDGADYGRPASGLAFSYGGLGDPADGLGFATAAVDCRAAGSASYVPTPAGDVDPQIRHLCLRFDGAMNAAGGGQNPEFRVQFKIRVR